MARTVPRYREFRSPHSSTFGCFGAASRKGLVLLGPLVALVLASTAQAEPPVPLGTAESFAVLAGTTITNTGDSVVNGDLGLHPGSAVTGFPPGTVNGAQHVSDAVALQAKTDLVTAYQDAAGRAFSATSPPDVAGQTLTSGVYRTGSVPSIGLTGNLTLDAQGDPNAVFIFQIESTLTTASASSVSLVNGAQACNVYWQVGSSATLGTTTAFKGTILALTSISVNNGATVDGELLARNGAVTLINDTITRSACAAGTGPGSGTTSPSPGPDVTGPEVRIVTPPAGADCTTRNFTARVRISDQAGIKSVKVYLDGKLVKNTTRTRFSLVIKVRGLSVGSHRITVVARDRAGNRSVKRRLFTRCVLGVVVPRFTG